MGGEQNRDGKYKLVECTVTLVRGVSQHRLHLLLYLVLVEFTPFHSLYSAPEAKLVIENSNKFTKKLELCLGISRHLAICMLNSFQPHKHTHIIQRSDCESAYAN